jgi:hypothetical protein
VSGYYLRPGGGLQVINGRFMTPEDMRELARRGREIAEKKSDQQPQMRTNGMSYLETYQRKLRLRKVVNFIIAENRTEHRQELADFSAELAALELECSVPEVLPLDTQRFPNHAGFSGYGPKGIIHVRMDMTLFHIARTAAHEVKHRWQIEEGRLVEEAEAEKFEEEFIKKYLQEPV